MMAEWQPIVTAPKDGKAVLLGYFRTNLDGSIYQEGGEPIVARWIERSREKSGWATTRERLNSEGPFSPTHWMPLPDPPRE